MKNQRIAGLLIIGLLAALLVWQIRTLNRLNALMESGTSVPVSMSEVSLEPASPEEAMNAGSNEETQWMEAIDMEHDQRLIDLERKIERLNDILLEVEGVEVVHGKITSISHLDGWAVEIESEEEFGPFGVSSEAKAYLIDVIGLVESPMEDLEKKVKMDLEIYKKSPRKMDTYTFIVVNGEILHIYQGWGDWDEP